MSILRVFLAVVLIVIVGVFVMGYLSGRGRQTVTLPDRAQTAEAADRARDGAAEVGDAVGKVQATFDEAALTTKIKAKMALDDLVKARSIDVTTRGTTVTLSGVVESKAEHDRAMALARETEGVTRVVDDLRMRQRVG